MLPRKEMQSPRKTTEQTIERNTNYADNDDTTQVCFLYKPQYMVALYIIVIALQTVVRRGPAPY